MTVYYVTAGYGWGAGNSVEEALEQYRKFNGRIPKGKKYRLTTIETPAWENIIVGEFEMLLKAPAKLLEQQTVTI